MLGGKAAVPMPALTGPEQKPCRDPARCHFNLCSHPRAVLLETVRRLGEEVSWQGSTKVELLGHWNNKKARKNILATKKKGEKKKKGKKAMAVCTALVKWKETGLERAG